MRKKLYIIMPLLVILLLTATSGRDDDYIDEPMRHTLSVLAPGHFAPSIRRAAENMAAAWEADDTNRIFELELSTYNINDSIGRVNAANRLVTMLAAGEGYDMFFSGMHPVSQFARQGYLTNIYTLIDLDPFMHPWASTGGRDDFYLQPLRAMEIGGRLYSFPLSFGFYNITVNAALPDAFVAGFTTRDIMCLGELMRMYVELITLYPEYDEMHFISGFTANYLQFYMNNFIDHNGRTADFTNSGFVDFLENLRIISARPEEQGAGHVFPMHAQDSMRRAGNHVFHVHHSFLSPAFAFIDTNYLTNGAENFVGARQITDTQGRLVLSTSPFGSQGTWAMLSFPSAGNSILAWEFTQHLISEFSQPTGSLSANASNRGWGGYSMATPIARELFVPHVTPVFQRVNRYRQYFGQLLRSDADIMRPETFDRILARIGTLNEMPMSYVNRDIPLSLFWGDFSGFMDGDITADELARRMQAEVLIWFAE